MGEGKWVTNQPAAGTRGHSCLSPSLLPCFLLDVEQCLQQLAVNVCCFLFCHLSGSVVCGVCAGMCETVTRVDRGSALFTMQACRAASVLKHQAPVAATSLLLGPLRPIVLHCNADHGLHMHVLPPGAVCKTSDALAQPVNGCWSAYPAEVQPTWGASQDSGHWNPQEGGILLWVLSTYFRLLST